MTKRQSFDSAPQSVSLARHFAREVLRDVPADVLQTAELMVSELASNCILHADSSFDLKILRTADEIRIEATDGGGGEPALRSPGPTDPTGRGLQIIDMLSTAWGVTHLRQGGKTVWVSIAISAWGFMTKETLAGDTAGTAGPPAADTSRQCSLDWQRARRSRWWRGRASAITTIAVPAACSAAGYSLFP